MTRLLLIGCVMSVAAFVATSKLESRAEAGMIQDEPSLVGYWNLDESAGSSTVADWKSGYTGTPTGGVTLGEDAAGPWLGTSADFNGTNGRIDVSYQAALNPNDFTVEFWRRRSVTQRH